MVSTSCVVSQVCDSVIAGFIHVNTLHPHEHFVIAPRDLFKRSAFVILEYQQESDEGGRARHTKP